MAPEIELLTERVIVDPGGQASVVVRVQNVDEQVRDFRLDVLGAAKPWVQLVPNEVTIYPGEAEDVTVQFRPPAGRDGIAGQVPFGVRAVCASTPESSAVAEGNVLVTGISSLALTVRPASSKARWSTKYRVEVANWGNAPVRLALHATDPDELLGFLLTPQVVDVPVASKVDARLRVRPRRPFFRGPPRQLPFRVDAEPVLRDEATRPPGKPPLPYGHDSGRPQADGAIQQLPLIGGPLVLLVVLAVVAAGLLAFLRLRSDAPETATNSVAPEAPDSFQVAAAGQSSVELRWRAAPGVEQYVAYLIEDDTNPSPPIVALYDIPPELSRQVVGDLSPDTKYCFQLVAKRNDLTSARTPAQCVTTEAPTGPEVLATPTELQASAAGGEATLRWKQSEKAKGYIVQRNGSNIAVVDAPITETTVALLDGDNCFKIVAQNDAITSEASNEQCVTKAIPVTTAPAQNLGVVLVVGFSPLDDLAGQQIAEKRVTELIAAGEQNAMVLKTTDYAALRAGGRNGWIVAIVGFGSEKEAKDYCAAKQLPGGCLTAVPGARDAAPSAPTTATSAG